MPRDGRSDPRGRPPVRRPVRRRRTHPVVLAVRLVAAAVSLALIVGMGMATSLVNRLDTGAGTGADISAVDGNTDATGVDGEDVNILVVGNDSRAGYTDAQLQQELSTTASDGMNTDTMMLVHVPADGSRASVVSFPRDSFVKIPGYKDGKLNGAYADGYVYGVPDGATEADRQKAGQAQLVRTISALSGVHIDHYVEVTLLGFFRLTQQLGGVQVTLCAATSDSEYSGLTLPAGTQTLTPKQALQFVRQRHGVPGGDLGRIKRQQYFIGAVIRQLLGQDLFSLLNYGKLEKLVDSVAGVITWDRGLKVLDLVKQVRDIAAGNVEFRTVPVVSVGATVQLPDTATLHAFFADLDKEAAPAAKTPAGPTTPAVTPGQVTVDVVNASGTTGLGTETADRLGERGFVQGTVGAGPVTATTEITYAPADQAKAALLAKQVPGAALRTDPSLAGTIRLTIGTDFAGLATASSPASAVPAPEQTAAGGGCVY